MLKPFFSPAAVSVSLPAAAISDDESGESWCPDCRLATPVIYSMIDKQGYTVIECDVGDRAT